LVESCLRFCTVRSASNGPRRPPRTSSRPGSVAPGNRHTYTWGPRDTCPRHRALESTAASPVAASVLLFLSPCISPLPPCPIPRIAPRVPAIPASVRHNRARSSPVEGRSRAERVASFSGGRVREFVSAVFERAISSPRESRDLVAAVEESLYEAIEAGRPSAGGRTRARGRAWSATSVSDPGAFSVGG
jgi:hypothetical protein